MLTPRFGNGAQDARPPPLPPKSRADDLTNPCLARQCPVVAENCDSTWSAASKIDIRCMHRFGARPFGMPIRSAPPLPPKSRADDMTNPCLERKCPVVAKNCDSTWNLRACEAGLKCPSVSCECYHSEAERRCHDFITKGSCADGDGCPLLHVRTADEVVATYAVDLESPADAVARLSQVSAMPLHVRARYVRLVVWGFAGLREEILKKFLKLFPLLHEMVLPDRKREANLLVYLCDILEDCASSNPRLRDTVFQDTLMVECPEQLW